MMKNDILIRNLFRRLLKLSKELDNRPAFKFIMRSNGLKAFKRRQLKEVSESARGSISDMRSLSRIINQLSDSIDDNYILRGVSDEAIKEKKQSDHSFSHLASKWIKHQLNLHKLNNKKEGQDEGVVLETLISDPDLTTAAQSSSTKNSESDMTLSSPLHEKLVIDSMFMVVRYIREILNVGDGSFLEKGSQPWLEWPESLEVKLEQKKNEMTEKEREQKRLRDEMIETVKRRTREREERLGLRGPEKEELMKVEEKKKTSKKKKKKGRIKEILDRPPSSSSSSSSNSIIQPLSHPLPKVSLGEILSSTITNHRQFIQKGNLLIAHPNLIQAGKKREDELVW